MYFYQGHARLQLAFDTPNQMGAFFCIILLCLCGAWLAFRWKPVPCIILSAGIAASIVAVCLSYSRGAVIAMFSGLALLCCVKRSKAMLLCILFAMAAVLLVPDLGGRLAGAADINNDASISNRLVLWRGGAAIFADNWATGADRPIGELFAAWYQPVSARPRYSTFVNDYLTIGARYGAFALFAYLAVIFLCIATAYCLRDTRHGALLPGMGCALAAYLISGIFSTLYNVAAIGLSAIVLIITILCCALIYRNETPWLKLVLISGAAALLVVSGLLGLGRYFSKTNAVSYEYIQVDNREFVLVSPQQPSNMTYICLFNESASLEFEAKMLLRPLACKSGDVAGVIGYEGQCAEAVKAVAKYVNAARSSSAGRIALVSFNEQLKPGELADIAGDVEMIVIADMRSFDSSISEIPVPVLLLYNDDIPEAVKELENTSPDISINNCLYTKNNMTMLINHIVTFSQRGILSDGS